MEEWLKRHRLLSAIGGVVGMIVATLAAVDVIWSLISDEPFLPYISTKAPQWVQIMLAIIFIAICIFCIVIVVKVYRQTKAPPKPEVEKKNLTDTLTAMHRRLIELQQEKALHTDVSLEQLKKALPALADRAGAVKLEDWPKFKQETQLRILKTIPPKPRMNLGGKFNYKKWARLKEEYKERVYHSALLVTREVKDELFHTKEWALADCIKVSEWLDGYGWGVKELRDNDQQWKPLYESIDNQLRIDDTLNVLIKEHIDLSYIYNSGCLIIHYSGKFKKDDIYSLILYEALMGSPMSPEQADMDLTKVLGRIEGRLKEMNNVKTTIVRCCVEGNTYQVVADNQGNDKDTVFVTLGTDSRITDIKALMGAGLPTIIKGGLGGNFITFKITELPPNISLSYLIYVVSNEEKPREFTAWSERIKSNITATFTGQCPKFGAFGPEETAPP